jgi:CspA family cold shock protein
MNGKVKWFDTSKGYGYIKTDDGKEVFVEFSGIHKDSTKQLKEGMAVSFRVIEGKRGQQATEVVVVG